jgi:RHS repeat-associated protein
MNLSTTSTAGPSQTDYGYTGEFTANDMVYLRARQYAPGMGRFLTRDTWGGDANSPMSFNRWGYVEGNPVNYTDPSGLCGLPGEPPCPPYGASTLPDWWLKQTQLSVEGLGYFDSGHIARGWRSAKWFVEQIRAAIYHDEIETKSMLHHNYGGMLLPLERATSGDSYWVDYAVSARITDNQINGAAYGMYIDFERGYEEYQSSKIFPLSLSGFAPADLPSDHLGFWAYINGYKRDEIPTLLQCLGKVNVLWPLSSVVVDSYGIAENHEFLPMIKERFHFGTQTYTKTRNIPWPAFLTIQPIPSGPNTWQVRNRSH